jgi:hypothetical protein
MKFSAEESRKILSVLIDTKRLTADQARAALRRFNRTVEELKSRLAALESGTGLERPRRSHAGVSQRSRLARRPRERFHCRPLTFGSAGCSLATF